MDMLHKDTILVVNAYTWGILNRHFPRIFCIVLQYEGRE